MGLFRNPLESAHQRRLWSRPARACLEPPNRAVEGFAKPHTPPTTHYKMEASMHALQAIAVVAVLIVGFGATLVVFLTTEVNRGRVQTAAIVNSISVDHQNASSLPVEKIHDMTFVDPQKD